MEQIDLKTNLVANEALSNLLYYTTSIRNFAKAIKRDRCICLYSANVMDARLKDAMDCMQEIRKQFEADNGNS